MNVEIVVGIQGPRSVGKSTLLADLAKSYGVDVFDLDDVELRSAVTRDARLFVSGPSPLCVISSFWQIRRNPQRRSHCCYASKFFVGFNTGYSVCHPLERIVSENC